MAQRRHARTRGRCDRLVAARRRRAAGLGTGDGRRRPAIPAVTLTAPQANTFARGTVALAASVSGGQAPTTVSYAVDGNPLASSSWDTTSVADGSHTVSATVTDGRGKTATRLCDRHRRQHSADDCRSPHRLPGATPRVSRSQPRRPLSTRTGSQACNSRSTDRRSANLLTSPDSSGGYTYSSHARTLWSRRRDAPVTDVATDNAGNTTASAPVTFTIGYGPPAVSVTSPADWTFAHGTTTGDGQRDRRDTARLWRSCPSTGRRPGSAVTTAPGSFAGTRPSSQTGAHTLSVTVTDARADVASSAVDPPDGRQHAADGLSDLAGGGRLLHRLPCRLQAHASDAHGIANVQLRVDGRPSGPC